MGFADRFYFMNDSTIEECDHAWRLPSVYTGLQITGSAGTVQCA